MKNRVSSIILATMILCSCYCFGAVNASETAFLDDNVYNLVTSFIGDASTSRGFAWTAVDGYEDMVLRYTDSEVNEYKIVKPAVVDKGTHLYYKADVTGLSAGTVYTYQIGNAETDSWYGPFKFTTKPDKVDSFSFVGVSDPQGFSERDYSYFESNIKTAIENNPDVSFMVNLGDMVNNGYREEQWKWHFKALEGYVESIPYMGVVGNHEAYNPTDKNPDFDEMWDAAENFSLHFNHPDNAADAMKTLLPQDMQTQFFQDIAEHIKETFYSFDYGNAHFAVLNTGDEVSLSGTYETDCRKFLQVQRDWLKSDLENSDAKWKIVLLHMGGYRADLWRKDIGTIEYFGDIIDKNGVDLVLQGHDHIYMRSYPIVGGSVNKIKTDEIDSSTLGTTYTVLGAAANKRYEPTALKGPGEYVYKYVNTEETQPVYCAFDVSDEKIDVIAKQLDGTVLDKYSIVKRTNIEVDDSDKVTVKGVTADSSLITVMVTKPEVDKVTSEKEIVYIDDLKADENGEYYFNFKVRNKTNGKYKIRMNINGITREYGYMYQPKMYVVENNSRVDTLSDISGNLLEAKIETVNMDNGRLFCIQYKDGVLVDASFVDVTVGPKGGMSVAYYGSGNVDEMKLFFWDKSSMKPILKPVIIK